MAKSKKVRKKVFLPKWQRYFVPPLLTIIWLMVTYQEFFSSQSGEMGLIGYLFFSLIMFFSGGMTFMMTTGKLPAYIIEEEKTE